MALSMKPFRDSGSPFIRHFALARRGDRPSGPVTTGRIVRRCLDGAPCRAAYAQAVSEIARVYESLDLETRATRYQEQIRADVLSDPRKRVCCAANGTLTNEQFEAGFQSLLATVRGRVGALRADLAALEPAP